MTAASAAYLNKGLELTAYSLRSSLAAASGSGSGLAFGFNGTQKVGMRLTRGEGHVV